MQEKVIVGVFASQICDRRSGAWAKESGLAPVPIGLVEWAGAIFHTTRIALTKPLKGCTMDEKPYWRNRSDGR